MHFYPLRLAIDHRKDDIAEMFVQWFNEERGHIIATVEMTRLAMTMAKTDSKFFAAYMQGFFARAKFPQGVTIGPPGTLQSIDMERRQCSGRLNPDSACISELDGSEGFDGLFVFF